LNGQLRLHSGSEDLSIRVNESEILGLENIFFLSTKN